MFRTPMILLSPEEPAASPSPSESSSSPSPTSTPPDDKGVAAAAASVLLDPDVDSGDDFGDLEFLTTTTDKIVERPTKGAEDEPSDDKGFETDTKLKVAPSAAAPSGAHVAPVAPGAQPLVTPVQAPAASQDDKTKAPAAAAASAATPQAAAAPAAQPVQQPGAAAGSDPVEVYNKWRETTLSTLASKEFAISAEDAQAIQDEPEKVLPMIAAKVYMTCLENITVAVQQMLPVAIENVMNAKKTIDEKTDLFYTSWPNLKEHNAKAMEIGRQWRALNLNASVEDFIKNVGPLAHQMLGIPLHTQAAKPPAKTSLPPHVPANGAMPQQQQVQAPVNVFEEMALAPEPDED